MYNIPSITEAQIPIPSFVWKQWHRHYLKCFKLSRARFKYSYVFPNFDIKQEKVAGTTQKKKKGKKTEPPQVGSARDYR